MPEKAQPPPGQESPLSAREQEVLRRVAQGLSSKAVGRQLFISASTVNQHLTSIFHKLGVTTRAQAVAVAVQQGLL
jgi:DNA-binding CsgD family transcriptional regulator